jgi:hypothetical protein
MALALLALSGLGAWMVVDRRLASDREPGTPSPAVLSVNRASGSGCPRPYSNQSPWNSPIPSDAAPASDSAQLVASITQPLTSDPTQFTYAVYAAATRRPKLPVYIQSLVTIVTAPNRLRRMATGAQLRIAIPRAAQPSAGSDRQLVLLDPRKGDEWGFWQFFNSTDPVTSSMPAGVGAVRSPLPVRNAYADFFVGEQIVIGKGTRDAEKARIRSLPDPGHMVLARRTTRRHLAGEHVWGIGATNGYHYNTRWSGVPPSGFASRGAGVPYLAGLVRPCEVAQGHIDHALAFAYPRTTAQFVFPATKSDGHAPSGQGLPEGARLQLDPSISDSVITSTWGCSGACYTIAKALQRYGMYVVDTGGHPKIIIEYEGTAHWGGRITSATVSSIPVSSLRLLRACDRAAAPCR